MADDDVIDDVDEFEEDDLDADLDVDVDDLDEDDLDVGEIDAIDVDTLDVGDVAIDDEPSIRMPVRPRSTADEVVAETRTPRPARRRATTRSRRTRRSGDPDDVEADLDTILKDRIAAADDEEDEEEVEAADTRGPETPDGVTPKKANEFVCPGCFLLVNRGQFGPADNMTCPVGESDCPAITQLQKAKK